MQVYNMTSRGSNKRQRLESPVQHETNSPFETHNLPHYRDLVDQPFILYEQTPTEVQFKEIVEKLDQSDVRKLLTQAAHYLDQSAVRKLLVNAAVSNELIEDHRRSSTESCHPIRVSLGSFLFRDNCGFA